MFDLISNFPKTPFLFDMTAGSSQFVRTWSIAILEFAMGQNWIVKKFLLGQWPTCTGELHASGTDHISRIGHFVRPVTDCWVQNDPQICPTWHRTLRGLSIIPGVEVPEGTWVPVLPSPVTVLFHQNYAVITHAINLWDWVYWVLQMSIWLVLLNLSLGLNLYLEVREHMYLSTYYYNFLST